MATWDELRDERQQGIMFEAIGGGIAGLSIAVDALTKVSDRVAGRPFQFGFESDLGAIVGTGFGLLLLGAGFGIAKAAKEQMQLLYNQPTFRRHGRPVTYV